MIEELGYGKVHVLLPQNVLVRFRFFFYLSVMVDL